MASPFPQTARALRADPAAWWGAAALLGATVLALGAAWAGAGRVPVYVVSDAARLEVDSAARPVAAAVGGRVVRTRLRVGDRVARGDVLVELDAAPARLRRDGVARQLAALDAQAAPLREELAASAAAWRDDGAAADAAAEAARAAAAEAEARERSAAEDARLAAALRPSGAVTDAELGRLRDEAAARAAAARRARFDAAAGAGDRRVARSDRLARVAALRRELAELARARAAAAGELASLGYAAEEHLVRAPAAGRVSEAARVEPGAVVEAGTRLGVVVPDGRVRAVAFLPADALGRVRAGQAAEVRLDGFAWTEYGALPARVAAVAEEPEGGRFRVELALDRGVPGAPHAAPALHGLPGTVAVAVERVSPAALVLRAAGRALDGSRSGASRPDGARVAAARPR
jgi:membrane fusion protein (multidrug efflux system)